MSISYPHLTVAVRRAALAEFRTDQSNQAFYDSPRLSPQGRGQWVQLLEAALQQYDDQWLATQLAQPGMLLTHEAYTTKTGKPAQRKVSSYAPITLAEGQFHEYYLRGVCSVCQSHMIRELEVYRAKAVPNPRQSSQAMIGTRVPVDVLMNDLRAHIGIDKALRLPAGPNSGLSVRHPGPSSSWHPDLVP